MSNWIDNLYYLEESSSKGFSSIPSSEIHVDRLLAGLPEYRSDLVAVQGKKKKTIVISKGLISSLPEPEILISIIQLHWLLEHDFCIYGENFSEFKQLNSAKEIANFYFLTSESKSTNKTQLAKTASQLLNLPADGFFIFTAENIKTDDFEQVADVTTLNLDFLTFYESHDFIFLKLKKLKALSLKNTRVQDITILLEVMQDLELLDIRTTIPEHTLNNVNFDTLKQLAFRMGADSLSLEFLTTCALLEDLTIEGSHHTLPDNLVFQHLKTLSISKLTLQKTELLKLINSASRLEQLEIWDSELLFLEPHDINWQNLRVLRLFSSSVSDSFLQAVFTSNEIEEITIQQCQNINSQALQNNTGLSKLKTLSLCNSDVSTANLQLLIERASELEELLLVSCKNLSQGQLTNLSLTKLKKLHLHTPITKKSIQALVSKATELEKCAIALDSSSESVDMLCDLSLPKLRELSLDKASRDELLSFLKRSTELVELVIQHSTMIEDFQQPFSLPRLKKLNLNSCKFSPRLFQLLLESAPGIEKLGLDYLEFTKTESIQNVFLPQLNTVDILQSNISAGSAQVLLRQPAVVKVRLSRCNHIDVSALKNLQWHKFRKFEMESPMIADLQSLVGPLPSFIAGYSMIDADTGRERSQRQHSKRQFIGNWESKPNPARLRKKCFNEVLLNDQAQSDSDVFILNYRTSYTQLENAPSNPNRKNSSVAHLLNADPDIETFFGYLEVTLSFEWTMLDSMESEELLTAWYLDNTLNVEIRKNPFDHFFYIRLLDDGIIDPPPNPVKLEVILQKPPKSAVSYYNLPSKVKEFVAYCFGFRDDKLVMDPSALNPEAYLNALKTQRLGACRHRTVVFKDLMRTNCPDIPVHILQNDCHMFVEVFHENTWVRCDLGGYDCQLSIDEDPELTVLAREINPHHFCKVSDPANQLSITFSSGGTASEYKDLTKMVNLSILRLDQVNIDAYFGPLGNLDTLEISNCVLTADALQKLFNRTPKLKTLDISNCKMLPDEFDKIDLSGLEMLEYVKFAGSFIPNNRSLNLVIARHPRAKKIKWVLENTNIIIEANDSGIQIKKYSQNTRKLPLPRYKLQDNTIQDFHALLNSDKPNLLLNTSDASATTNYLHQMSRSSQKVLFYVDKPEDLLCQKSFIKRDGAHGIVCNGPGGPLFNFIQQHPEGIIVVNYNNFKAKDIARFNSLLDPLPKTDGIPLKHQKVLGTIDKSAPNVYQGADFYSRFIAQFLVDGTKTTPESLVAVASDLPFLTIELAGGADWEMRLAGHWSIEGRDLHFKTGRIAEGAKVNYQRFVFNNPPKNNPDFDRFIYDLSSRGEIRHQGEVVHVFEHPPQVELTHDTHFDDKRNFFTFVSDEILPESYYVLNQITLKVLLGQYQLNEYKGISLQKGVLEQNAGKTLSLYLTSPLGMHQWLDLFDHAQKFNVRLVIHAAPNVFIPEAIQPEHISRKMLPPSDATQWHVHSPQGFESRLDDVCIDISELLPADLLDNLQGRFDSKELCFIFENKTGYLDQLLQANKRVVLSGHWSPELKEAMHPFLVARINAVNPSGKLVLISDAEQCFPFMPRTLNPRPEVFKNTPITAPYHERLEYVTQALEKSPFIFLMGDTGVGKSYFMKVEWEPLHSCFYGENAIADWADATLECGKFITLFIDEANLTNRQWSEFQGLFNHPPSIFYKGKYILLTEHHRVIFAGNPFSYGGERQMPRLFLQPHPQIEFKPIPLLEIIKGLKLDPQIAQPIEKVIEYINQNHPDRIILTPRECHMMVAQTQTTLLEYPDLPPADVARYFAFNLTKGHIPKDAAFEKHFKPTPLFLIPTPTFTDFLITPHNRPAYEALCHHMNLRKARILGTAGIDPNGLGGLILEGAPGIGKSDILIKTLVSLGLEENHDFYHIAVSLSYEEKEKQLLEAFHNGKVVIIDEINSSPMLERLLNALLEGHDLQEQPPFNRGFLLLGTQNPISFAGRRQTTLPLQHRLQTICLEEYDTFEMQHILSSQGIPPKVAGDMTEEFLQHQQSDTNLCFRDLLNWAVSWREKMGGLNNIQLNVTPSPQIGSICKTTAMATIESYYAKRMEREPIPMHKRGTHPMSIRQVAKSIGSLQGEILEFARWEKLATSLGYEAETITFTDFQGFLEPILRNLHQDNLPMVAFSVKEGQGQPDANPSDPEAQECVGVITGYNYQTDEVTIAHLGNTFIVDAVSLFNSNQALTTTRKPEHYFRNPKYTKDNKLRTAKYIPDPRGVTSIIPEKNTGFKGKLLVVKKPESLGLKRKMDRLEEFLSRNVFFKHTTAESSPEENMKRMQLSN